MLKNLVIKNFILIEAAEIEFSAGLNIITGESGSGKSVILKAIEAALGAKVSSSCIFQDKNVAIIEATFELKDNSELRNTLSDYDLNKNVTLRREISKNGRSRFFVNDQLISPTKIKECSIFFADYISQKQTSSLSQEKYVRTFVDALSDCKEEVSELLKLWTQSKNILDEINLITSKKKILETAIPNLKEELAWVEKINYKPDEEKLLEQEHTKLLNSFEIKQSFSEICNLLTDQPDSVLFKLRQIDRFFQTLQTLDPQAENLYKTFKAAFIEFEELGFELSKAEALVETDPNLVHNVEERLKEIDLLKKKFGLNFDVIESKKRKFSDDLDNFEKIDDDLQKLKLEHQSITDQIDKLCSSITFKRNTAKAILENRMQKELDSLNLNSCSFKMILEKKDRSAIGDENVHFLFSANPNVKAQPMQKIASGGELSRVMLALKCIIANKDPHHCLIFDEIDSNVGGKSATIIGDKLLDLSLNKQVICVTHFVQVAKKATSHFLVEKTKKDLKNLTLVSKLKDTQKDIEYQRMIGLTPS